MKDKNSYSRYEKARIIAARTLQISQGAPSLINLPEGFTDPFEIAKLEWKAGVIPIEIKK